MTTKESVLKALRVIPGVGPAIAADLYELGLRSVADLKNKNPEALYEKSCLLQGVKIDRCLLYVYRCAVYYASHTKHAPEKLLWWNWKERQTNTMDCPVNEVRQIL